jgi:hypothetical protein
VFEAFNWYRRTHGQFGQSNDQTYFPKTDSTGTPAQAGTNVEVTFFEGDLPDLNARRRALLIRSAYRHEPDFDSSTMQRQPGLLDDPGLEKLTQVEQTVRRNYERLSSLSLQALFNPANSSKLVGALREEYIGKIQATMKRVFGDLVLRSPGDPLTDGAFFFDKGASSRFHYKNLSAGEKAAFDLILDFHLKIEEYDDTVFCIDEPEIHLGSRVQAALLRSLYAELPQRCQLWVATHSLGMMRSALSLHRAHPEQVVFLDTFGIDFDQPATLTPTHPGREFWRRSLEVAIDDLAGLVAPERVVLCEGADPSSGFDASIYRCVFSEEFPDTEFLSVGNSHEVKSDHARIGAAIEVIAPGTRIERVIDRDELSENEVDLLRKQGVRALSRRNIESYLLDDEILTALCASQDVSDRLSDLIACRDEAVAEAAKSGRAHDDYKSARRAVQAFAQKDLGLRGTGSTAEEFLRATIAPLITPNTATYCTLKHDVLGE